ncbi:MAG: gamma-glutamyltransferase, partial [Cyanobacteria bacterium P01_G01_bin.49]
EEAISYPRIHWENNILNLEPMPQIENLEQLLLPVDTKIVPWQEPNMFFGVVQGVRCREKNILEGIGDPRRAGAAIVC